MQEVRHLGADEFHLFLSRVNSHEDAEVEVGAEREEWFDVARVATRT